MLAAAVVVAAGGRGGGGRGGGGEFAVAGQVDDHLGAESGQQLGRLRAGALGPGARLALRSHGRSVVKAESTTRSSWSRCAAVRTSAPAPAGARRWMTSTPPAGEATCTVPVPSRCDRLSTLPLRPGGTE